MNSMELVRFPTPGARLQRPRAKKTPPPFCHELVGPARNAIVRARHLLLTRQRSDGTWLGRQTGDVPLASQLVFLLTYLDRSDSDLAQHCAATILGEQRPDGGWSGMAEEFADISASVQAYFALKLMGHDPTDERMAHARAKIRDLGGADAADIHTRYFLALFGQVNYDDCVPLAPEKTLVRRQDSRLHAPMSIVWFLRPLHNVAIEQGVRELFIDKPANWPTTRTTKPSGVFNRRRNPLLGIADRLGRAQLRRRAARAEAQILANVVPTRIAELSLHELAWHIIALRAVGYPADSLELSICDDSLDELIDIDEDLGIACPRFRNGKPEDSALAIRALAESGISASHSALGDVLATLCEPATTTFALSTTDACNTIQGLGRSAAADLDIDSSLPPDIDVRWDWQYAAGVSEQISEGRETVIDGTIASCVGRLLDDQNRDGGWSDAADSRRRQRLSEPCATGAALESLAENTDGKIQTALRRGVHFLRSRQLGDGSWAKSDGTQQLLCTSAAIRGLLAAGAITDDDSIAAAANWLVVQQQPSGSWNGSATQTAWAILGLLAAGCADHLAVRRGIKFLLNSQEDNGGWIEQQKALRNPETGNAFRNDLHSVCWPLVAMSRFVVAASSAQSGAANGLSLRLVGAVAEI